MKLFFSILSLLLLSIMPLKTQPRSPEEEAFYNNNYQAYNSYATELEYETNGYSLLVLVGDYEAKVSYSIFFELKDADNYNLLFFRYACRVRASRRATVKAVRWL